MRKVFWAVVLGVFVLSIIGCGKAADIGKMLYQKKGTVLARVGNEVITLEEFNDRLSKLPDNIKSVAEQNKAVYLDNLVLEALL